MSATGSNTPGTTPPPVARRPRRLLLLGLVVAVVLAALVVVLASRGGAGSTGTSAAARSSAAHATGRSADTSIPPPLPTPTPTGPTGNVNDPPSALPAVPLNSPASESNGVVASIEKIESIQGSGSGPGNVSGPAVRVTVRLQNGSPAAFSLGGVAVDLFYGADKTPASPLDDPSQRPFYGMLAAGKSSDAVYVFTVPSDARASVTVQVGYQAGAPLLLFTGAVH